MPRSEGCFQLQQDACAFYNDLAFCGDFESIVFDDSEGVHIAQAIGTKKGIVLQNHGLLTCSDSVKAIVFWLVSLERLCHTQLVALAAVGGDESRIVKVGEREAAK